MYVLINLIVGISEGISRCGRTGSLREWFLQCSWGVSQVCFQSSCRAFTEYNTTFDTLAGLCVCI